MAFRRLLFISQLLLSFAAHAAVDPSRFSELRWRLIGPFRGGRVLAVTGVPSEPEHFYFGSVNGGVWETRDAGRTWDPIFDSQPVGSIGAIAVAPSNPKVLYAGSGEADMRSDIAQGNGMYKSADGGKTWSHIGLTDTQQIGRILVHPTNPDIVYVAALGHPYGPNEERGVFRSTDGGKSWRKVLGKDQNTGAIDLAFEPGNPEVIYAALWQTRRTPWSVYPPSNGPGSGLYKTTDGGDTWTELRTGLPAKPGRIGLAVAPTMPQRVYAIVDAEAGGMYRSDDGGATWTRTSDDSRIWGRGWYFGGITVEPDDAGVVYSCNINLYQSNDAGKTFVPVKGAPGGDDYHQLWIDPDAPQRRILGVDQGCVVSTNKGDTWSSWYNQPTGQFYHVITDDAFPYNVYGSQQDSGSASIPSRTNTRDGITMMEFREVTAGGESDNIAPDPNDHDIIYGGRVEKLDRRTHQTRSIDPMLATMEQDRRTWTLPLVFSYRDPKVLYFANQKMYRTDDGGGHWSVISPDLTREDPGTPPNLDPATAALNPQPGTRRGVIYAIAPSRVADDHIWAGTDDGQIWRTTDEGLHWTNVTPPSLTGWSKVGIIETSHFDVETAYAAIDRHRLDDFSPYIYRTHDGGKNWTLIANGIPAGIFVNSVREDSETTGLLYAGTERGVYVSFDDGSQWQPLQMNLPVTSVRDIDVHGDDVVIATHGRAFWILDDVTPLRQAPAVTSTPWLFRPAKAYRARPAGFTGTPMPKDEPLAANPPAGAVIDYIVGKTSGPVTLEIVDPKGGVVRRYSSADPKPAPDPSTIRTAPEWFARPSTLESSAGMHRFVWPLRYPLPLSLVGALSAGIEYSDGIWAPPGNYSVVLTVDGNRVTQPLVVAPDPRVKATDADYAAQFSLVREIESLRARTAAALKDAESTIDTLEKQRTLGAPEAEQLVARARELSEIVPSDAWWRVPRTTSSLRFADAALAKLAGAVDGADGAPTKDAIEGWAKAKPLAEGALKAWGEFQSGLKR